MKKCDYFACPQYVEEPNDEGFDFCCYHTDCLEQVIANDLLGESFNSVAFCLSALNGKAYLRSTLIL